MKKIYQSKFDVIVVGGGVSGCTAALAAARQGANVLVIEQSSCLGGALTTCGVGPMMSFHAGGIQVIKGIMEEIVCKLMENGASSGHIVDSKLYCDTVTHFNSETLKYVLDELLINAGCKILFNTFLGGVNVKKDAVTSLTVCNKDGLNDICANIYIDATGDADLASFAGVKTTFGRKADNIAQPMTMNMKYCNVDTQKLKDYILKNKAEFSILKDDANPFKPNIPLDIANFKNEFEQARSRGGNYI